MLSIKFQSDNENAKTIKIHCDTKNQKKRKKKKKEKKTTNKQTYNFNIAVYSL